MESHPTLKIFPLHTVDFLNAVVQSTGVIYSKQSHFAATLDDNFNLCFTNLSFPSKLSRSTLVYLTQLRVLLWACFPDPALVFLKYSNLTVYIQPQSQSLATAYDAEKSLFYVIEIKGDKTKIVDRFELNADCSLPVHSKYVKSAIYKDYKPAARMTLQEGNLGRLLAAVFQLDEKKASSIQRTTFKGFLETFSLEQPQLQIRQISSAQGNSGLFIGLKSFHSSINRLGILLHQNSLSLKAIGSFDSAVSVNGTGLIQEKGELFVGLFRENVMLRELSYDKQRRMKLQPTSAAVQAALAQQHLRSLHFQHQILHFPQLTPLIQQSCQIIAYLQLFEQQFEHRQNGYSFNSSQTSEADGKRAMKYVNPVNFRFQNQEISSVEYDSPIEFSSGERHLNKAEIIDSNSKKPGFIYRKDRSISRSPNAKVSVIGTIVKKSPSKSVENGREDSLKKQFPERAGQMFKNLRHNLGS